MNFFFVGKLTVTLFFLATDRIISLGGAKTVREAEKKIRSCAAKKFSGENNVWLHFLGGLPTVKRKKKIAAVPRKFFPGKNVWIKNIFVFAKTDRI